MDNKYKRLTIGILILSIIVVTATGYAFFSSVVNNNNREQLTTETATMSLRFADNDNGVSGVLSIGQSLTKKFTLENTGTVDAYGMIKWYNLVNTYSENSLTWNLCEAKTENGNCDSIGTGVVPTSSSGTIELLKDSILVPVGQTYYYNLTITFNDTGDYQSGDLSAIMHSKFSLAAGTEPETAIKTIQKLARGANTNSTAVIDKTNYVQKYVFKFNGNIADPNTYQYDTLSDCEQSVQDLYNNFGSNINTTCQLDSTTNKYNLIMGGDSSASNNYTFDNLSSCQSMLTNEALLNTTCDEGNVAANACTDTLAYDGTEDNNLRYVGANPCNYVTTQAGEDSQFQIVGVMNNIDSGESGPNMTSRTVIGTTSTKLELISLPFIARFCYSYDGNWYENNAHYSPIPQLNIGKKYDIKQLTSGGSGNSIFCAGGGENANNSPVPTNGYLNNYRLTLLSLAANPNNFKISEFLNTIKNRGINNTIWYTGGADSTNYTAGEFYQKERGTNVYSGSSTYYQSKGGLAYPSDFGFSVGGSVRSTCLNTNLGSYAGVCARNSWLTNRGWTHTPISTNNTDSFYITDSLNTESVDTYMYTSTAFYIDDNLEITDGDGSYENPYVINIEFR